MRPEVLARRLLARRETLMPFLWKKVVREGQLFGDARTPQLVRDVVTKTIFVAGAGTTPFGLNLKKGSEYAAISWALGRRAKLVVVETRFNFVC